MLGTRNITALMSPSNKENMENVVIDVQEEDHNHDPDCGHVEHEVEHDEEPDENGDDDKLHELENALDGLYDEIMAPSQKLLGEDMVLPERAWKHSHTTRDDSWIGEQCPRIIQSDEDSDEANPNDRELQDVDEWCMRSEEDDDDDNRDILMKTAGLASEHQNIDSSPPVSRCTSSVSPPPLAPPSLTQPSETERQKKKPSIISSLCSIVFWLLCVCALFLLGLSALVAMDSDFDSFAPETVTNIRSNPVVKSIYNWQFSHSIPELFSLDDWDWSEGFNWNNHDEEGSFPVSPLPLHVDETLNAATDLDTLPSAVAIESINIVDNEPILPVENIKPPDVEDSPTIFHAPRVLTPKEPSSQRISLRINLKRRRHKSPEALAPEIERDILPSSTRAKNSPTETSSLQVVSPPNFAQRVYILYRKLRHNVLHRTKNIFYKVIHIW